MPGGATPIDAEDSVSAARRAVGSATAVAHANVALVKYWGKRDEKLNLPAVGSISLTLSGLRARATVETWSRSDDRFVQDGRVVPGVAAQRMADFLDRLSGAGPTLRAIVEANFPVGAGLASSAAIFCAVTTAALSVLGRRVTRGELSAFARQGSGSAARSVYGGLVEWFRGDAVDGSDSIAEQIAPETACDLALLAAITSEGMKRNPSRDAMRHVAETSPLYGGWLEAQDDDLVAMRRAIAADDLAEIGRIAEENCLRMHATGFAARPPVVFWTPATMAVMDEVRRLRDEGTLAFFTIDAGPQVKVLCRPRDADRVAAALERVPGVLRVLRSGPGPGVAMEQGEAPWR